MEPPTGGPTAPIVVPETEPGASAGKGKAREVKVWLPFSSADARPPPQPDLPDSYFAPTASEAQRAFASQVAARERLTDAPLLTKQLRDRDERAKREARYQKYPLGRMRIRFADRTMLEGVLPSTSRLSDLYDFVAASLASTPTPFVLYQTPPRKEYRRDDPKISSLSLLDLQLAPAALFYIKFVDESLNAPSTPAPLEAGLMADAAPLPPPATFTAEMVPDDDSKGKAKASSSSSASGAKVPKWLKTGIGKSEALRRTLAGEALTTRAEK